MNKKKEEVTPEEEIGMETVLETFLDLATSIESNLENLNRIFSLWVAWEMSDGVNKKNLARSVLSDLLNSEEKGA